MRLPNGYGSVTKIGDNKRRRNPYRVRKTIKYEVDENGHTKQVYKTIGYYSTKQEALQALSRYNEDPYDVKSNSITFSEIYEKWSQEHFKKIVPSAQRSWKSAYNYCRSLYNMRFKDIKVGHLESTIKEADVGSSTKARMKSMFNLIYKYAAKHEITNKNYAELCDSVKITKAIKREPFSDSEIKLMWKNIDFPFVDMILIGIYSGWRPQELANILTKNVDLDKGFMFGGIKTEAGRNRYVPIHHLIFNIVKNRYNNNKVQLFNSAIENDNSLMTYDKYRTRFNKVMKKFNMNHKPHDTRHTFITKAKFYNMDEYVLKLIVGHSIEDITEREYTHRSLKNLKKEMKKIIK